MLVCEKILYRTKIKTLRYIPNVEDLRVFVLQKIILEKLFF